MRQTCMTPLSNRLGGAVNLFEQYFEIWQPFPGKMKNSNFPDFQGFYDFEIFRVLREMTTVDKVK